MLTWWDIAVILLVFCAGVALLVLLFWKDIAAWCSKKTMNLEYVIWHVRAFTHRQEKLLGGVRLVDSYGKLVAVLDYGMNKGNEITVVVPDLKVKVLFDSNYHFKQLLVEDEVTKTDEEWIKLVDLINKLPDIA